MEPLNNCYTGVGAVGYGQQWAYAGMTSSPK